MGKLTAGHEGEEAVGQSSSEERNVGLEDSLKVTSIHVIGGTIIKWPSTRRAGGGRGSHPVDVTLLASVAS